MFLISGNRKRFWGLSNHLFVKTNQTKKWIMNLKNWLYYSVRLPRIGDTFNLKKAENMKQLKDKLLKHCKLISISLRYE